MIFLQEYTRGPCPEGKLMVLDRDTGYGRCGCDQDLVSLVENSLPVKDNYLETAMLAQMDGTMKTLV